MNSWQVATDVLEACFAAGCKEFVVCGGARNVAILEALARAEEVVEIKVWHHFEERSAGFFALGRMMQTGAPCAVVTTSGTAAAELLPAVVEAFYQSRPLIAITADRPVSFRGTGAPQAIDQTTLFEKHACLTGFSSWTGKMPLHLNVPLEETFRSQEVKFSIEKMAEFSPPKARLDVALLARWLRTDVHLGLVVMLGGLESAEHEEAFHFCQALGAPVVAEATSGLREALQALAIPDADRTLKAMPPGKVLRLGDIPSARFWRDLEDLPEVCVHSASRQPFTGLARNSHHTQGPLERLLPALGDIDPVGDANDYLASRARSFTRTDELLEAFPESEPGMLRTLSTYISLGKEVFLGNSLPIREWNLFAQWLRPITNVRANRGANGIDGQISTWLGNSAEATDSWALVGDLTALYDLAAPYLLNQIQCRGRVLAVINNSGGEIFSRLPLVQGMHPRTQQWMRNTHTAHISAFAKLWDMDYLKITNTDDFDQLETSDKMLLLEVVPDEKQTQKFWQAW